METKDLLDMIGEADGDFIQDAKNEQRTRKTKRVQWVKRYSLIAACLVAFVGVGAFLLPKLGGNSAPGGGFTQNGNTTSDTNGGNSTGNWNGGSGHDESSVFMYYAGPVLPLTLEEEKKSIFAERKITMDFAPWVPDWISNEQEAESRTELTDQERQNVLKDYNKWFPEGGRYTSSGNLLITDSYVLTNEASENQTIRVLYPFVSKLSDISKNGPVLSKDGTVLKTELCAGSFAGHFEGVWDTWPNGTENPGTYNIRNAVSWEDYQAVLADGTYRKRALNDFVDLSDVPVVVYTFTDAWGPEEDDRKNIPNPSIRVMFELDYEKTTVLSYGFLAGLFDYEKGIMGKGFSIPREGQRGYGEPYYLIVIGDDLNNMKWQGYATGGFDTNKKIEAGVTITRSESDLETALRVAAFSHYQDFMDSKRNDVAEKDLGFQLYFGLMKEHLMEYGLLSENRMERYETGNIEDLDVENVKRVFYLAAEVTIPAGERVTLNAVYEKEPSHNFTCATKENQGVNGYDMMTALDSNLNFTKQMARLYDRGQIEIVRQNFGFDLANGVNEVVLDLNTSHYYLEVKSSKE